VVRVYRRKLVVFVAALLVAAAGFGAAYGLGGSGALAAGNSGTRPGWGCGDTNHTHTGPPGKHLGNTDPCGTSTDTTVASTAASTKHSKAHGHSKTHKQHKQKKQKKQHKHS
jgi:hypothetical protein